MRQIGAIAEVELAERFQNAMIAQGISCSLDDDGSSVGVWIHDENRIATAREQWAEFVANPQAEKFVSARAAADAKLQEAAEKRKAARKNTVDLSRRWSSPVGSATPIFTLLLIAAAGMVWVVTDALRDQEQWRPWLFFSTDGTWRAIEQGEWWRILSPILLHFGPMHILFNSLTLWDVGRLLESRMGTPRYVALIVAIAVVSNILEFQFGGKWFGGLSGVVFGLFGYAWIKGKYDPQEPIVLSWQSTQWMLIWFVVCWIGAVGRIVNWCHTGGLVTGMVVGFIAAKWRR